MRLHSALYKSDKICAKIAGVNILNRIKCLKIVTVSMRELKLKLKQCVPLMRNSQRLLKSTGV